MSNKNKIKSTDTFRGYKVFNPDWTCLGFQYEVGKTYTCKGEIMLCENGFHFCPRLIDCFNYYKFDPKNKVAEVEAFGDVFLRTEKGVASKIKIVRELLWGEVLNLVNQGHMNYGMGNVGDANSGSWNTGFENGGSHNCGSENKGNWNSGTWNEGDRNTGNYNRGSWNTGGYNGGKHNTGNQNEGNYNSGNENKGFGNTGDHNEGFRNSGNWNSGYQNTGNGNSGNDNCGHYNKGSNNTGDHNRGHCNTGSWNTGSYNTGFFNTKEPKKITVFDKKVEMTRNEFRLLPGVQIINSLFREEENNQKVWGTLSQEKKKAILSLPNFDAEIFKETTGVDVNLK